MIDQELMGRSAIVRDPNGQIRSGVVVAIVQDGPSVYAYVEDDGWPPSNATSKGLVYRAAVDGSGFRLEAEL